MRREQRRRAQRQGLRRCLCWAQPRATSRPSTHSAASWPGAARALWKGEGLAKACAAAARAETGQPPLSAAMSAQQDSSSCSLLTSWCHVLHAMFISAAGCWRWRTHQPAKTSRQPSTPQVPAASLLHWTQPPDRCLAPLMMLPSSRCPAWRSAQVFTLVHLCKGPAQPQISHAHGTCENWKAHPHRSLWCVNAYRRCVRGVLRQHCPCAVGPGGPGAPH